MVLGIYGSPRAIRYNRSDELERVATIRLIHKLRQQTERITKNNNKNKRRRARRQCGVRFRVMLQCNFARGHGCLRCRCSDKLPRRNSIKKKH